LGKAVWNEAHVTDLKRGLSCFGFGGLFREWPGKKPKHAREKASSAMTRTNLDDLPEKSPFPGWRGKFVRSAGMGRSVQIKTHKPGYHALVYPSSVSDRGYIEETSYLGARSIVWHIEQGGVLFSAEGTVGKSFAICDESASFITNIHGLILSPKMVASNCKKSAYLCMYFHFLRNEGFFDKISGGGQGGSHAVGYWDRVRVPLLPDDKMEMIASLYDCHGGDLSIDEFYPSKLGTSGVYQLNNFRMRCMGFIAEVSDLIGRDKLNMYKKVPEASAA
jgi:hypothetical protein